MGRGMKGARSGLAVLFLVYLLNYVDRSLVYVLFEPMRRELALSDLGLALLGSTAFVLFYTTLGVPFGRLSDRVSRTRLIAAGLATWSLASAGTGLVHGFAALLLCRILVGVGEATLGPAAYSLIADWFPKERRATASALFAAGIPVGAGVALIGGGQLGQALGWRATFPLLSLPGLLLAVLVLLLPEPPRAPRAAAEAGAWAVLRRSTAFVSRVPGYALVALASNAAGLWLPKLLSARFGLALGEVGLWVGLCAAGGGLLGTLLGGAAADALAPRVSKARFGAAIGVATAVAWAALLVAPTLPLAIAATFALMGLGLAWLGPAAADVQDAVPASHRATAIAAYTLVVNLVGVGVGAPLVGALSDRFGLGAALWVEPVAAVLGAVTLAGRPRGAAVPAGA